MTKKDFNIDYNKQKLAIFTVVISILIFPIVWFLLDFINNYFVLLQISIGFAIIITAVRIFIQKIDVGTNLYGLVIPLMLIYIGQYIYSYHKIYERIQYQAKIITNDELNMYLDEEKRDNYYIPKYEIKIKDSIVVKDMETSKIYIFKATQDKKQIRSILSNIKSVKSLYNLEKSNCDILMRIETNKNFLIFYKNNLTLRFQDKSDQKAINDLLNFITLKTNGLVDFNASCPN